MICNNCSSENHQIATYCGTCGSKLIQSNQTNYIQPIIKVSVFFFTLLLYIVVLHFTEIGNSYTSILISDVIIALIVLVFYFLNFKSLNNCFRIKKFKPKILLSVLILTVTLSVIVHFISNFLNQNLFDKQSQIYYDIFKDSPAPLLYSIISLSLFPAVFEEIAFRGIMFNEVNKIVSLKQTILITSILFTIIHLSLISAFWIFPLGLVFGYLRAKYRTIVYGIIGHFIYNTSIVLIEML